MSVSASKIPPAPYIIINEEYIARWAKVLDITSGKGYKVKRTVFTEGERQYMIVDNDGKYTTVSPKCCELI